jgi:mRNA interferase MazF
MANLRQECDILMDQLRAIDNRRLLKRIGTLPDAAIEKTMNNLKIVLDID